MSLLRTLLFARRLYHFLKETPDMLSKLFPSTNGPGVSKKILVLFITGTLLPVLNLLDTPMWIVQGIGQLGAIYLGGQSLADAAGAYGKSKNGTGSH